MIGLLTQNAKAIGAFVGGVAAYAAITYLGFEMPADVKAGLSSFVASLIVWLVPNWG